VIRYRVRGAQAPVAGRCRATSPSSPAGRRCRFTELSNGFASCAALAGCRTSAAGSGHADIQAFFDRWVAVMPTPLTQADGKIDWRTTTGTFARPDLSWTRVAMRRFVPSKMQGPKQIQEAGGRRSASGVFEDRTRLLKALTDGVVIRRRQVDLSLDRRHVRAKLPGAVVRKMQGRCLSLQLAHDLAKPRPG
jgi:hypothetical protein